VKYFNGVIAELPAQAEFSLGPKPGFSQGFSDAYDDQVRNWSQFGLQYAFAEAEQEQLDLIYERTGKRLNPIVGLPLFKALAKNFEGRELDPEEIEWVAELTRRMGDMAEIKKANPDVLTYDQMWERVQGAGKAAEQRAQKTESLAGFGGWVGSFLGRMAGSFTYRDPLNIATLGIGGVGRSAALRIATEFGANGAVEAINQFTGVQSNRELLGLDHSTEQALAQVGLVGTGAALIRGAAEGVAAGWRGIVKRYGARTAPDIAVAALQREAELMVGRSPFGTSRVAQGVHHAELRNAVREFDAPLFSPRSQMLSGVSLPALAARSSDDLFTGSSEPLETAIGKFFDASAEREFTGINVGAEIRGANLRIQELTDRVSAAEVKASALDEQIKTISPPLPQAEASKLLSRLAEVNREIQETDGLALKKQQRKSRLNRLGKEKAAIEGELTKSQKAASDIRALTGSRDKLRGEADDLRLRRAQVVADIARRTPGARRGEIDTRAIVADLLGRLDPEQPALVSPLGRALPDRDFAEKITEAQKVLDEAEVREPEIIKPEPKEGEEPVEGNELVDLGQKGEPVSLDFEVKLDIDGNGEGRTMTLRQALEELKDDDDLVANMKACLIA
jgi:hypothetical protein